MAKRVNTISHGRYNVNVSFTSLGGGCCLIFDGETTVTPNEAWAKEEPEHDFTESCELDSSAIRSVAYDKTTNTLKVIFQTGRVYTYDNVSHRVYIDLITAESAGKFFNRYVRGVYDYHEQIAA